MTGFLRERARRNCVLRISNIVKCLTKFSHCVDTMLFCAMCCDDYSGVRVVCAGGKGRKKKFTAALGCNQIHQMRRALVNGLRIQRLLLSLSNDPNGVEQQSPGLAALPRHPGVTGFPKRPQKPRRGFTNGLNHAAISGPKRHPHRVFNQESKNFPERTIRFKMSFDGCVKNTIWSSIGRYAWE